MFLFSCAFMMAKSFSYGSKEINGEIEQAQGVNERGKVEDPCTMVCKIVKDFNVFTTGLKILYCQPLSCILLRLREALVPKVSPPRVLPQDRTARHRKTQQG